jgi:hypothetical protein
MVEAWHLDLAGFRKQLVMLLFLRGHYYKNYLIKKVDEIYY